MAVRLARKPERPWHMRRMRPPSSGAAPRLPPAADGRCRGGRGAARRGSTARSGGGARATSG